jgi:hypothetical protein
VSPPASGSKNKPSQSLLPTCFTLTSFLAYSSTLKMEATSCSKRRLTFNRVQGVISQIIVPFLTCENLNSYINDCSSSNTLFLILNKHTNLIHHTTKYFLDIELELRYMSLKRTRYSHNILQRTDKQGRGGGR